MQFRTRVLAKMGSATKALKRLLRFMVRRRTFRSKTRSDKIPLGEVPQVLSETSTTTDSQSGYQPLETVDSRVHTEVSPAHTMASPAPQCPGISFDDIGVLLQPEKHTCKEEPIDCESSSSTIDKKSWTSFGCPSDDLLCDLSEDDRVSKTNNSNGPLALDVESLHFQDGRIKGVIQVTNMAYEKYVTVRWSVDGWKTWIDTDATFHSSLSKDTDLFEFIIPSQTKTDFAVRYQAAGQEVWDNNSGWNYQFSPNTVH